MKTDRPPSPLDPKLNYPPDEAKSVHLMGVGGTGMAALAGMLQELGMQVCGSDIKLYPPMSDYLAELGIVAKTGYKPENLSPRPDLVIVGNVIRADNPEALRLAELKIPYLSFPQALSHYFIRHKRSLVVAGTHGKTTTASLLATMLHSAGLAPGFMIGGIVKAFGRSSLMGKGDFFVSEGDEYDTAFFDKGPKFLHYRPEISIITSVEFDHADIYPDLAAVKKSFARLISLIPQKGLLIAHGDDPILNELCQKADCRLATYGLSPDLYWSIDELEIQPEQTRFTVKKQGSHWGEFLSRMPGRHNALNALAVIALLSEIGLTKEVIAQTLLEFKGVKRRQELLGEADGVMVIDDFAHHPSAVRETLAALRAGYPDKRLIAVFDPRTNSSRRKVFQDAYTKVFSAADKVLVRVPEGLAAIPEDERFSAMQLAAALCEQGQDAMAFAHSDDILTQLLKDCRTDDLVVIMSNGGFDNIHRKLLERLQERR